MLIGFVAVQIYVKKLPPPNYLTHINQINVNKCLIFTIGLSLGGYTFGHILGCSGLLGSYAALGDGGRRDMTSRCTHLKARLHEANLIEQLRSSCANAGI